MTMQLLPQPWWYPMPPPVRDTSSSLSGLMTLDATYSKVAMVGSFYSPGGATDISKIILRWGTIVKAGGSAVKISLQNLSTSSPVQPDNTADQEIEVANADAGLASNTQYRTAALSANRTVANGDLIAVVAEWGSTGRLGSDSIIISSIVTDSVYGYRFPACMRWNGSAWSDLARGGPIVAFESSTGVMGTFLGHSQTAATGGILTQAFTSANATHDELGNIFRPVVDCRVCGFWLAVNPAGVTSDFDLILYSGTTALATLNILADQLAATTRGDAYYALSTKIDLTAGQDYRIVAKANANNLTLEYLSAFNAATLALVAGSTCYATGRVDAGSWSYSDTNRLYSIGVVLDGVSDGGGGGEFVSVSIG